MSTADPCGYGMGPEDVGRVFSAAWHRGHMAHHLTVYPDVDQGTRDNLASFIVEAQQ